MYPGIYLMNVHGIVRIFQEGRYVSIIPFVSMMDVNIYIYI